MVSWQFLHRFAPIYLVRPPIFCTVYADFCTDLLLFRSNVRVSEIFDTSIDFHLNFCTDTAPIGCFGRDSYQIWCKL